MASKEYTYLDTLLRPLAILNLLISRLAMPLGFLVKSLPTLLDLLGQARTVYIRRLEDGDPTHKLSNESFRQGVKYLLKAAEAFKSCWVLTQMAAMEDPGYAEVRRGAATLARDSEEARKSFRESKRDWKAAIGNAWEEWVTPPEWVKGLDEYSSLFVPDLDVLTTEEWLQGNPGPLGILRAHHEMEKVGFSQVRVVIENVDTGDRTSTPAILLAKACGGEDIPTELVKDAKARLEAEEARLAKAMADALGNSDPIFH